MNRADVIRNIVWLDQLAAAAKAEAAKVRAMLHADARAEFEEHGAASTWRIPDIATVTSSVTHESVYVSDEKAFTAWVAERYPTEVEVIRRVRAAWQGGFLSQAIVGGLEELVVVDPDTGEVVPGLSVKTGGEFGGISIRPTTAVKEVLSALAQHGLRELAAGYAPGTAVVVAELEAADA